MSANEFPFTEEQMSRIILLYNQGLGTTKIAKELGNCNHNQVRYALRKYDVEIRSSRGRPQKSIDIPHVLLNLINGLLLGDATMFPINEIHLNSGLIIAQTINHLDFIEWIQDQFSQAGIKAKVYHRPASSPNRQESKALYTTRTKEFTKLRLLWYPGDTKTIPRTLRLTKETLIGWYISDGTRHHTDAVTLYTNGFTFNDCSFLQGLLLGTFDTESRIKEHTPSVNSWSTNQDEVKPTIYIPKESARKFFDAMGPCPVRSFRYKWPDQ